MGIDLFDRRREKDIGALFFEQLAVAIELPRIFRQIFSRAELGGVHENGNGNRVALRFCGADQRQVAFVKSAHGWNEAEALSTGAGIAAGGVSFRDGGAYLHGAERWLAARPMPARSP